MKRFILLGLLFFLGCVTIPRKPTTLYPPTYLELSSFCKMYGFSYNFNTLDDIIFLTAEDKDIRLLLNSSLFLFNGHLFSLKNPPYYCEGKIYLPRELKDIVSKKIPFYKPSLIHVKTIVIDPGHGGKDPGAISPRGLKEKDVNLKVAKLLKEELEKKGFVVYLTRTKDVYLSLQRRVEFAREKNADLFISIHANSNRNRRVNGVEVYYLSPWFNKVNKPLNLAKKRKPPQLKKDSLVARAIFWDMICSQNNLVSREFANILVRIFRSMGFKTKPPKKATYYVLKFGYVPSVLVEIGYLSNYYEEKLLRSYRYQKQVAEAIALGVFNLNDRYYKLVKRNVCQR